MIPTYKCPELKPKPSEIMIDIVNPSRLVPTWRQVDEGAGGAAEEDEVDADRVDEVEDVDHAVALLDEEHQVAQDKQDQPDRAELGPVDEPDKCK